MLDFAEFVAINKFDRKGAADALRDVAKQVQRNKEAWTTPAEQMPVFGTMAARFNDDGVTALYQALQAAPGRTRPDAGRRQPAPWSTCATAPTRRPVVPAARTRYLAEITDTVRGYKKQGPRAGPLAREIQQLRAAAAMLRSRQARQGHAPPRPPSTWPMQREDAPGPGRPQAAGPVARDAEGLRRRRIRGEDPRQGNPHRAHHQVACRAPPSARSRCRSTRTTAKS